MVLAHGIGGRSDLPVPILLALYGAAVVLLITFLVLLTYWRKPRLRGAEAGRPLPAQLRRIADAPATLVALRVIGLILGTLTLAVAWAGAPDSARNPAPTWFWVWFWVGLAAVSAVAGPVWYWLNPLRSVAAAVGRLSPHRRRSPEVLGYWPAAAGLLIFLWIELVYDHADSPRTIALFITCYTVVHVTGGVLCGPGWFDRADSFEACSRLFGLLSPFGWRADGLPVIRLPFNGLATLEPARGLVTTVGVLLGSTAFDGLTRTRWWRDLTTDVDRGPYLLLGTAGLLGAIAVVLVTYVGAVRLSASSAPADRRYGMDGVLVHSLLPIALGYTVAHYFSLAVFQGQAGYLLAADPLGRGWDLYDVGSARIDYAVVGLQAIALVQLAAIVLGHVVAVVAAHDRSLTVYARQKQRIGQYPLLIVMVGYSIGAIALLMGS